MINGNPLNNKINVIRLLIISLFLLLGLNGFGQTDSISIDSLATILEGDWEVIEEGDTTIEAYAGYIINNQYEFEVKSNKKSPGFKILNREGELVILFNMIHSSIGLERNAFYIESYSKDIIICRTEHFFPDEKIFPGIYKDITVVLKRLK